jgi:hypothetical protein
LPKKPVLHMHVTVSDVLPAMQGSLVVASAAQMVHSSQSVPSP